MLVDIFDFISFFCQLFPFQWRVQNYLKIVLLIHFSLRPFEFNFRLKTCFVVNSVNDILTIIFKNYEYIYIHLKLSELKWTDPYSIGGSKRSGIYTDKSLQLEVIGKNSLVNGVY